MPRKYNKAIASHNKRTYLKMSIVSIVSTSPTIDRIEPTIVKVFKVSFTASEGSGAFTFYANKK
jgi:hypothetical protein